MFSIVNLQANSFISTFILAVLLNYQLLTSFNKSARNHEDYSFP